MSYNTIHRFFDNVLNYFSRIYFSKCYIFIATLTKHTLEIQYKQRKNHEAGYWLSNFELHHDQKVS